MDVAPAGRLPRACRLTVSVRVLDPASLATARVALAVDLEFIAGAKTFHAAFSLAPLAGPATATAKTLTIWSDPAGPAATVSDILGAVGLAPAAAQLGSALPSIGSLLGVLALEEITLTVDDSAGTTSFSDFAVRCFLAGTWQPFSWLALPNASIDLRYDGNEWSGTVTARTEITGGPAIDASFVLPTSTAAGALSITAGERELTVAAIASWAGLSSLAGVPVLGPLVNSVSVTSAELVLAAEQASSTPDLAQVAFGLYLDTQALGALSLTGLALDVRRTIPAVPGSAAGSTALSIEATWKADVVVDVGWNSADGILHAGLRTIGQPRTIAQLLADLFPGSAATARPPVNALLPLIGDITILAGSLVLDTSSFTVKSFSVTPRSLGRAPDRHGRRRPPRQRAVHLL